MSFKLPFSELANRSAADALDAVEGVGKKRLGDLKVYDLLLHNDEPVLNGVYLFFSPSGECLYVGKNSAQKFVERIPWHFALDEGAWMNHYLKRTRQHKELETLAEAAAAAKDDLLLLIPVKRRELIKPLEKFFRVFAVPRYNAYSSGYRARYKSVNLDAALLDVLSQL